MHTQKGERSYSLTAFKVGSNFRKVFTFDLSRFFAARKKCASWHYIGTKGLSWQLFFVWVNLD